MKQWLEKPIMFRRGDILTIRMSVRDIETLQIEQFEQSITYVPDAERALKETLRCSAAAWASAREIAIADVQAAT